MHARRTQYGTFWRHILYCMCVFCMCIAWCQLTHLHEHWGRYIEYYCLNVRKLKVLLTHQIMYCDTLQNFCRNARILPDGKVFIIRIPYINTVWFYWRVICSDGEFIPSVTFFNSYLSKRLPTRNFIQIFVLKSLYKLWQTHNMNST